MVFAEKPADFQEKFEIVSCFFESEDKILLLLRQDHKLQGNTWGVPAGKVDMGENIEEAIAREIREETGYLVNEPTVFKKSFFIRYPEYDFTYHIFHLILEFAPPVLINSGEHKDYRWVSPAEALAMPLIPELDYCIKDFYQI